jgi:hypothetical protein
MQFLGQRLVNTIGGAPPDLCKSRRTCVIAFSDFWLRFIQATQVVIYAHRLLQTKMWRCDFWKNGFDRRIILISRANSTRCPRS